MTKNRVAVVTGANKGIGYEICYQLANRQDVRVVLTARDAEKGKQATKNLTDRNLDVNFFHLDVSRLEMITKLIKYLEESFGQIDILVNNAGIFHPDDKKLPGLSIPPEIVQKTFEINFMGPLQLCQAVIPVMKKQNHGRIINVSSGMGALHHMGGGSLAYRISKVSLNALTKILASELEGTNIMINTMHPGWVKTDMGGKSASRSINEGADTAVWLALDSPDGISGKFYQDRQEIEW